MGSLRARSWLGWTLHCRVWGTLHLHTEVWGSSLRVEVPDPLLALRFSAPGGPPLFPGIWSLPSFTPVMAGRVLFMPHLCEFFFLLLLQLSEPRGRGSLLSGAPTIHSSSPGWARVTSSPYTSFTHRLQCNVRAIPRFPGLRGQGPLWRLWLYLGQTVICLVWTEVILEPQGRARAAERRVLPNSDRASICKDRCWREAFSPAWEAVLTFWCTQVSTPGMFLSVELSVHWRDACQWPRELDSGCLTPGVLGVPVNHWRGCLLFTGKVPGRLPSEALSKLFPNVLFMDRQQNNNVLGEMGPYFQTIEHSFRTFSWTHWPKNVAPLEVSGV